MPEGLRTGLTGEASVLVSDDNTAEAFGNAGVKVYATPMLVGLMEQASIDAIRSILLPNEGSVGTKLEMSHTAATPIGMTVTARAELVEVAGKKLVFDVVASDAKEIVGKCRHERYVVGNMAAFLAKAEEKQKNNG